MRSIFWRVMDILHAIHPARGKYTSEIGYGVVFKGKVAIGTWTRIESKVRIGRNVSLGDWTIIGKDSVIGAGSIFGPWASVGRGVKLGVNVRLGSHTIVQDGVTVPDAAVFADGDLVTANGVIENGSVGCRGDIERLPGLGECFLFDGCQGTFLVPEWEFDHEFLQFHGNLLDLHFRMLEDYRFGRLAGFEPFRIEKRPRDEHELAAALRAIITRISAPVHEDPSF
ncbi:hypothetical protein ACEUZ9_000897 [Paracoccus litorisediminis]|uniref:hypothetical protein n=1 Tax=Paracoccus litorisediminis TaxID=2006130 RepID=UPI00372F77B9